MLLFLLAACRPTPPPPTIWRIAIPPSLRLWMGMLESCLPPQTVLVLGGDEAEMRLHWGEPFALASPAFAIGEETPVVITHPENGISTLSEAQVRAIFRGQIENWQEIGGADQAVDVWVYPLEAEEMRAFEAWLGGGVTPSAHLAMTPQEMLMNVQNTPGAIGLLGEHWVLSGVDIVARLPAAPLLLVFRTPPSEEQAAWITCLQQRATSPSPPQ
ncbi:MAG: substrate-binding domain-containing protein [Anaerolineales bacterium]